MKEKFNLIQALIYLEEGKAVKRIGDDKRYLRMRADGLIECIPLEDDKIDSWSFHNVNVKTNDFELYEPILDIEEKAYLENVLRPFKDRVNYVYKRNGIDEEQEYVVVYLKDGDDCTLPFFKKRTMYKGMKLDKPYKLKDLGLFDRKIY